MLKVFLSFISVSINRVINSMISLLSRVLYAEIDTFDDNYKILVFRTGSLGDSICTMPILNSIHNKFANSEVDILTNVEEKRKHLSLPFLLNKNLYSETINYLALSKKELLHKIGDRRYDIVIELSQDRQNFLSLLRNMIFFKICGIKHGYGWHYNKYIFERLLHDILPFKRETERLFDNLKALELSRELVYPYNITAEDKLQVEHIVSKENIKKEKCIGLVIGAKRPENRWPMVYFIELSSLLIKEGYRIVVLGGSEDAENADMIKKIDDKVLNLCGYFTPLQTGLFMRECDCIITNDTGPMHLSYSNNVATIAIFSARDLPIKWFPPEKLSNIVLRNYEIKCQVCLSENNCTDNKCLKDIGVDEVLEALNELKKRGVIS